MDPATRKKRHKKFLKLHEQKLDGGKIGRELGISRQRVYQMRKELGLAYEPAYVQLREKVALMIGQGHTYPEIAAALNRDIDLIYQDAKILGLKDQVRANRAAKRKHHPRSRQGLSPAATDQATLQSDA